MSSTNVFDSHPTSAGNSHTTDYPHRASLSISFGTSDHLQSQCHPEIWFNDGNIILVAGGTAFRVYRGLLAAQSIVFCDMFSSSTPRPDETLDWCYDTYHMTSSTTCNDSNDLP